MSRRTLLAAILAVTTVAVVAAATIPPRGDRSIRTFNADRLAQLEVGMWQAYYAKERLRLFGLLILTMREQYHYSWVTATKAAFHVARAAATFGDATDHYEVVLPDLETAYATVKQQTGARFYPADVARAELAWWAARRVPGENAPEQIGRLIAQEYAALYEAPLEDMIRPGELRARAAALRDAQAAQPDWPTIGRILTDSYRELQTRLSPISVAVR
jgi:hypothetical protein